MRALSSVLAMLMIIAITIAALSIALTVISNYMKSHQPRGESIDISIVAQRSFSSAGSIAAIKVTLYISCIGPNCDKYRVDNIVLYGYDRVSGNMWRIAHDPNTYHIKHGVTKISIVGYYDTSWHVNEIVANFRLCGPSSCKYIYKSVSIG